MQVCDTQDIVCDFSINNIRSLKRAAHATDVHTGYLDNDKRDLNLVVDWLGNDLTTPSAVIDGSGSFDGMPNPGSLKQAVALFGPPSSTHADRSTVSPPGSGSGFKPSSKTIQRLPSRRTRQPRISLSPTRSWRAEDGSPTEGCASGTRSRHCATPILTLAPPGLCDICAVRLRTALEDSPRHGSERARKLHLHSRRVSRQRARYGVRAQQYRLVRVEDPSPGSHLRVLRLPGLRRDDSSSMIRTS